MPDKVVNAVELVPAPVPLMHARPFAVDAVVACTGGGANQPPDVARRVGVPVIEWNMAHAQPGPSETVAEASKLAVTLVELVAVAMLDAVARMVDEDVGRPVVADDVTRYRWPAPLAPPTVTSMLNPSNIAGPSRITGQNTTEPGATLRIPPEVGDHDSYSEPETYRPDGGVASPMVRSADRSPPPVRGAVVLMVRAVGAGASPHFNPVGSAESAVNTLPFAPIASRSGVSSAVPRIRSPLASMTVSGIAAPA